MEQRWGSVCGFSLALVPQSDSSPPGDGSTGSAAGEDNNDGGLAGSLDSLFDPPAPAVTSYLFGKLARPQAEDLTSVGSLGVLALYYSLCKGGPGGREAPAGASWHDKAQAIFSLFDFAGQGEVPRGGILALCMSLYVPTTSRVLRVASSLLDPRLLRVCTHCLGAPSVVRQSLMWARVGGADGVVVVVVAIKSVTHHDAAFAF